MPIRPGNDDVLLIIDVQNDFCPGGALAVADGDAVVSVINRLAERFDHILLTQDWHPSGHSSFATSHAGANPFDSVAMPYGPQTLWPDHCVQGTAGAAFHPDLVMERAELIIRKGFRPKSIPTRRFLRTTGVRRPALQAICATVACGGYSWPG
jgi:nicotinamidase/pyrazinamidase